MISHLWELENGALSPKTFDLTGWKSEFPNFNSQNPLLLLFFFLTLAWRVKYASKLWGKIQYLTKKLSSSKLLIAKFSS
jgi:hypothetical protein